jgi:DNA-binding SARP family transcriptional activator
MLHLNVIGPPSITLDGNPVALPLGKPFGMLCYLAVTGHAIRRDELAELLWPGVPRDKARASTRQALWILRKALGNECFASLDPVELAPDAVRTDVEALRDALASGRAWQARELYTGTFLEAFALPGARPWHAWVEDTREELESRLVGALEALAGECLESGAYEDAIRAASGGLALNPSRLELHRVLIESYLDQGDFASAREALFHAERHLDGIGRAGEMLAELRQRADQPALVSSTERDDGYGFYVEFVGRTAELSRAMETLAAARRSEARVVAISGPPGIGKTRLAMEVLQAAAGGGAQIVRIKCHRAEKGLALGVAGDLAKELLALRGAAGISPASDAVLAGLNPGGGSNGHTPVRQEPAAYADAILDLIHAVAFEGPLAVLVDDLQWVDAESRVLLARVARKLEEESVLLLLTTRDALGAADLLDEGGDLLELGPLDTLEVQELLHLAVEIIPPEAAESVGARIAEASGGNPLFVGEILKRLADDGVVTEADAAWQLDAQRLPDDIPLPTSVQDLIDQRLARLPEESRTLCHILAARSGAQDPTALKTVAGLADAVFLRVLSDLVGRGVLEWVGTSRVDFAHEHLREAFTREGEERSGEAPASVTPLGRAATARRRSVEQAGLRRLTPFRAAALIVLVGSVGGVGWLVWPSEPAPEVLLPVFWSDTNGRGPAILRLTPTGLESAPVEGVGVDPIIGPSGSAAIEVMGPDGIDIAVVDPQGVRTLLTDGPEDERPLDWSPDGRSLLYWAGWQTPSDEYRRDLRILDMEAPENGRSLGIEAVGSSGSGAWSPVGTTIAVVMQDEDVDEWSIQLIDPTGSLVRVLVGGSPPINQLAWSPEGRSLAFASGGPGVQDIHMVDVRTGLEQVVGSDPGKESAPLWLSEGYLAYSLNTQGRPLLVVRAVDQNESFLLEIPGFAGTRPRASVTRYRTSPSSLNQVLRASASTVLEGTGSRWVDRVTIAPNGATATPGEWLDFDVRTSAADSTPIPPLRPIEWRVTDPEVAEVTGPGRVRALRSGTTELVAALPGWRADAAEIVVRDTRVSARPRLLADDWTDGINDSAWQRFGDPLPFTRPDGGPTSGTGAFHNNGDQNYSSGIISRVAFALSEGLTLEVWGQAPFTGQHFEALGLSLTTDFPSSADVSTWTPANAPTAEGPGIVALMDGESRVVRLDSENIPMPRDPGTWHRYAIQLSAGGDVVFLIDGQAQYRYKVDLPEDPDVPLHVVLFGSSLDNDILHGPVRLYEGERYGVR